MKDSRNTGLGGAMVNASGSQMHHKLCKSPPT